MAGFTMCHQLSNLSGFYLAGLFLKYSTILTAVEISLFGIGTFTVYSSLCAYRTIAEYVKQRIVLLSVNSTLSKRADNPCHE